MSIPKYIVDAFTANLTDIPPDVTLEYLAEEQDNTIIAGMVFPAVVAMIILLLRLYSRVVIIKGIGIDDWLAIFSAIIYVVVIYICISIVRAGAVRHQDYLQYIMPNATFNLVQRLDFALHILYATALFACRMSGLAFYRRLCDRNYKLIWAVRAAAVFLVLGYIPQMCLLIFHCLPLTSLAPSYWQSDFNDYTCLSWLVIHSTNSSLSITCDLVLFCLPVALIYTSKASFKTKLALCLVLFPGILVIVVSIFRLYIIVTGYYMDDGFWIYGPQLVIECAEVGCTIIALSIPGLKPLMQRSLTSFNLYMKSLTGSRSQNSKSATSTKITDLASSISKRYTRASSEVSLRGYVRSRASNKELLDKSVEDRDAGIELTTTEVPTPDLDKNRQG